MLIGRYTVGEVSPRSKIARAYGFALPSRTDCLPSGWKSKSQFGLKTVSNAFFGMRSMRSWGISPICLSERKCFRSLRDMEFVDE